MTLYLLKHRDYFTLLYVVVYCRCKVTVTDKDVSEIVISFVVNASQKWTYGTQPNEQ